MTSGEKRLARRLKNLLDDDCLVWYDIPIGKNRRYPDFIILHPSRGLLFLEVKDWKSDTLNNINNTDVELLTSQGLVSKAHPLEQARQYAYAVLKELRRDPILIQASGKHKGNLIMPYGSGAVFTNITRRQIQKVISDDERESLLPDHLIIYKDQMTESTDAKHFQQQLWGMFNYQFGNTLTLPQINQVRWHLFPEIRIDNRQEDLFADDPKKDVGLDKSLPEVIRIMDIKQEQLARSIGEGHRVIHGVSGSGKTLILGFRCMQLVEAMSKPILVLCYNVTLASKLRAFMKAKRVNDQVQVYHFHGWCGEQLSKYGVEVKKSEKEYHERQVDSVIDAVEKGDIPAAQYGALLVDEGHDFEEDWLRLIVKMVDPDTDSLLLLYDDAQSIYDKRANMGFSLSSVGIKAQGRTSILRLNYRNTKEILACAYSFAKHYIDPRSADDDHIPLIEPETAGTIGSAPTVKQFENFNHELDYALKHVQVWRNNNVPLRDISILVVQKRQGDKLEKQLKALSIPYLWMRDKKRKQAYDPTQDKVTISTIHSSKGLEFPRVMILGIGQLQNGHEEKSKNARLLYVGMTRAQQYLLMTTSGNDEFSQKLLSLAGDSTDSPAKSEKDHEFAQASLDDYDESIYSVDGPEITGNVTPPTEAKQNVYEAVYAKFGIRAEGGPTRFRKPGWFYSGPTSAKCPECGTETQAFRKPYKTKSGSQYHYWALLCPKCKEIIEPSYLSEDERKKLYASSDLRPSLISKPSSQPLYEPVNNLLERIYLKPKTVSNILNDLGYTREDISLIKSDNLHGITEKVVDAIDDVFRLNSKYYRDFEVLSKHMGLRQEPLKLHEIALQYGFTRQRADQIFQRALRKCSGRKAMKDRIEEYLKDHADYLLQGKQL